MVLTASFNHSEAAGVELSVLVVQGESGWKLRSSGYVGKQRPIVLCNAASYVPL